MKVDVQNLLKLAGEATPGPYHLAMGEEGDYFAIAGGSEKRSKALTMARFDCLPFKQHAPQGQRDAQCKLWGQLTPEVIKALCEVVRVAQELTNEYANPAPDYTMRNAIRMKLAKKLEPFEKD